MPELPEVERARRLIEHVAIGHRILEVTCAHDPIVLVNVSAATVTRTLTNRMILGVRRRGKHLWLELDQRPWPCFHLGMTGHFRTKGDVPLQLASSPSHADQMWPPRFSKLHLVLTGGIELALTNKRRLGRIRLRHDPEHEPPISELGFDPLLDLPSPTRFAELFSKRSGVIKSLLLDQSFAAGVGNWIADEVLYQARLDPRRHANQLSASDIRRLRLKLRHIIQTAVRANADKTQLPKSWLFHRRWGRKSNMTIQGRRIEHLTIGGRTTAWVPEVQE